VSDFVGIAARDPVGCRKKHSGQPVGQFASAWVGFVDDVPLVIGVFLTLLMGARNLVASNNPPSAIKDGCAQRFPAVLWSVDCAYWDFPSASGLAQHPVVPFLRCLGPGLR